MKSPAFSAFSALVLLGALALAATGAAPERPGRTPEGGMRLPTGWTVTPAGRWADTGDFPLAVRLSPDGRWAVASCSGERDAGLSIVNLATARREQLVPIPGTWLGLAFADSGRRLVAAGGLSNRLLVYDFSAGHARLADSIALGPPYSAGPQYPQGRPMDLGPTAIWPTGLAVDDARGRLYVVTRMDSALYVVDLRARTVLRRVPLGAVPFTCVVAPGGARVYASLWSASAVAEVDPERGVVTRTFAVGDHPCDLVAAPDGTRLFVANANLNTVSVLDLSEGRVGETITTSLDPRAPNGSTPDAVALDAAGHRLVVANADNNCVALFDVSRPGHSRPLGFLPTGWYPTAVQVVPATGTIVVANGRGRGSWPTNLVPADTTNWCGYLSYRLLGRGGLSILAPPDARSLEKGSKQVLANMPSPPGAHPKRPAGSPIPARPGGRTPIKHVFYVFKENRSYDQVLGDLPQGDGDPSLCLFGEDVTPNHHALARDFVLLDNTYLEADGSADGHNWGMAAYSTDYVDKSIATSPIYDYEGGNPHSAPSGGYLWDACARAGVSYRSYGEYVFNPDDPRDTVVAGVEALRGHVAPRYRGYDLEYSDLDRYEAWLEEFDRYDRDGGLPRLSIIRLPNDHTQGTCSGVPTPRAYVAQNDLALGKMVERISHSRYWKESAIFVIEDDAANGPDHVDAHRTPAFVASPWAKRGVTDSGFYTNAGMLRTIELILGLEPMSQFDAAAAPMYGAFTGTPDFTPWDCRPARMDLTETNMAGAYGQDRCDRMNWKLADLVPPDEVNEILWRNAHGALAQLPPMIRGAFTTRAAAQGRLAAEADDD